MKNWRLLAGDGDEERRHGDGYRNERDVERTVLVDFARLRLVFVRRDVDDVVLLQIEVGRREDVRVFEVEIVHRPHAVLFADQRHVLALAVDRQVARPWLGRRRARCGLW